ncbi:hypothetical protein BX070DRAFT_233777 [Coemansia spiralis]|nr:hypothetical protein BX070DRAFT_233777 [Coemansia spiralis]
MLAPRRSLLLLYSCCFCCCFCAFIQFQLTGKKSRVGGGADKAHQEELANAAASSLQHTPATHKLVWLLLCVQANAPSYLVASSRKERERLVSFLGNQHKRRMRRKRAPICGYLETHNKHGHTFLHSAERKKKLVDRYRKPATDDDEAAGRGCFARRLVLGQPAGRPVPAMQPALVLPSSFGLMGRSGEFAPPSPFSGCSNLGVVVE